MWLHNVLDNDGSQCCFLSSREATVLSTAKERGLLLELAECKERILRATRRPDGSEWGVSFSDAEFQRVVGDLARTGTTADPRTAAVRPLARRYQEIRAALAMANSRLVAHIAKRYANRGIPAADLIQEGFCGLLTAIDRFDPVNTTRLATYAVWWIRQAIQRAVAAGAYPVRLNPKQLRRLAQAIPQSAEIASGLPADVRPPDTARSSATWRELAAIRPRVSLDSPCRFDDSTPLAELLASERDQDQEESETVECLGTMIRILKPREQTVLKLRFGLDGEPRHSLSQVSKVLDVSKERIRQIQQRALEKLRIAADEQNDFDASRAEPSFAGSAGSRLHQAGLGEIVPRE
jgi:RNA polymerase sigma factor (sigma-70 family)